MSQNHIKFINKGCQDTIVLIPGWATDAQIFGDISLPFNKLIVNKVFPSSLNDALIKAIDKNKIKKISILGFSLGGFLAKEFASKHPKLIKNVFLVGIRKKYPENNIESIINLLKRNKNAYLLQFYKSCFNDKRVFLNFKNSLFKSYCNKFSIEYLLETLEYLGEVKFDCKNIPNLNTILYHGKDDLITPIEEIRKISEDCSFKLIELDAGHCPFWQEAGNIFEKHRSI